MCVLRERSDVSACLSLQPQRLCYPGEPAASASPRRSLALDFCRSLPRLLFSLLFCTDCADSNKRASKQTI